MNAPVKIGTFPATKDLHEPGYSDLKHLPGLKPHPLPLLRTIEFLKDPLAGVTANVAKFGRVYRVNNFGGWNVGLIGPEANELVLFDRDKIFSSELGWTPILGRVFPRGLMLLDFDHHRADRKTLSVAFKPEPMRHYLGQLNEGIARGVAGFPVGAEFKFYPAIKALTLDLAATSFLGIAWGPEADAINRAFVDMVAASIGIVRVPLPGTAMGRGVKGHRFMSRFFAREIPKRRGATGDDFFTQFCNARNDAGDLLSDQEIIDHMNFLMMAAHDTLTSSLTSTLYYLALNPEWQDRVRAEIMAIRADAGPALPFERLGDLEQTEWCFKEALRLLPPVPSIPRRALRDFEFAGVKNSCRHTRRRQPDVHPPHGRILGRARDVRPFALQSQPLAGPAQICLGSVRRRGAHVHWSALCVHADEVVLLHAAVAVPSGGAGRLYLRLPDVPDTETQGRPADPAGATVAVRRLVWGLAALVAVLACAWAVLRVRDLPVATLRARYASPASQFVEVMPGLTVHLRDEGPQDAPPLVLVHGSNASLHTWEPWVVRLKGRFRLISFDLPAQGLTGPAPDGQYTQAAYARVLAAVADNRGLDRFALAGNSMGGGVAARFAADHPERIAALILVDASGAPYAESERKVPLLLRLVRLPGIRDVAASITPRSLVASSLRAAVSRPIVSEAMVTRYWELLRYPGNRVATIERFAQGYSAVSAADLARVHAPVLILWGREDHFIPVASAAYFARALPQARTIIYDGVGHLPMEEVPDRSAADLAAFLTAAPSPLTATAAPSGPGSAPSPARSPG